MQINVQYLHICTYITCLLIGTIYMHLMNLVFLFLVFVCLFVWSPR